MECIFALLSYEILIKVIKHFPFISLVFPTYPSQSNRSYLFQINLHHVRIVSMQSSIFPLFLLSSSLSSVAVVSSVSTVFVLFIKLIGCLTFVLKRTQRKNSLASENKFIDSFQSNIHRNHVAEV